MLSWKPSGYVMEKRAERVAQTTWLELGLMNLAK